MILNIMSNLKEFLEGKEGIEFLNEGAVTRQAEDHIEVDSDTGGIASDFYYPAVVEEDGEKQVWIEKAGMQGNTTWKFSIDAWDQITQYIKGEL